MSKKTKTFHLSQNKHRDTIYEKRKVTRNYRGYWQKYQDTDEGLTGTSTTQEQRVLVFVDVGIGYHWFRPK